MATTMVAYALGCVGSVCSADGEALDATAIRGAFLDSHGNVVVVNEAHQQTTLTIGGGFGHIRISKDLKTVAWLKLRRFKSSLFVCRDGHINRIKGNPDVRNFWFVDLGTKIGVDTGGTQHPGNESLYDLNPFKLVARFSQAAVAPLDRPAWSEFSDRVDDYGD